MRKPWIAAFALVLSVPGGPAGAGETVPTARPTTVVRAAALYLADGTILKDAVVVLRDGRVASVGSGLPAQEGEVRLLEAAAACPGFVDLWTRTPGGNDAEDPRPFAPALRAADGFDPVEDAAAAAAREGVLVRVLLPSDRNPLGGRAAVLRPAGGDARFEVSVADAGGTLAVTAAAARRERYPGSLAGIVRGLEAAFDGAAGTKGALLGADPALGLTAGDRDALREMAAGTAPSRIFARSRAEVRAALALAGARHLRPVLVDPRCTAADVLDAAAAGGVAPADLSVVLALDIGDPAFLLEAAGILSGAGVRVGFGTGGAWRGPDAIRLMAALARRHGLPGEAARGALLGRGFAPLGRSPPGLAVGDPADLLLLDGDPLDPSSRVIRVVAGGEDLRAPGGAR